MAAYSQYKGRRWKVIHDEKIDSKDYRKRSDAGARFLFCRYRRTP